VIERVLGVSVMLVMLLVLVKGLNWNIFLGGFGGIVFSFWASSEFPVKFSWSGVFELIIIHTSSGWIIIE
jgi:hypothetical protein